MKRIFLYLLLSACSVFGAATDISIAQSDGTKYVQVLITGSSNKSNVLGFNASGTLVALGGTTSLGATTALTAYSTYIGAIDTRTVTLSAAASNPRAHIHFVGTAAAQTVITWPGTTVKQIGGSGYASTTTFEIGNVEFDLYSDGTDWFLADSSGAPSSTASLTATQVGYGGAGNTLTGEAAFTYDASTNTLGVDAIQLGSAGITITQDADGALTLKGAGNGSDEDFRFNFDDTANTLTIDSTTGGNLWNFSGIDLQVPTEVYDATGWNGDLTVPTKDAVRDKIEAVIAGTGGTGILGFTASDTSVATGKVKGFVVCPYAGTISGWSIVVDAGTATVKVWKIASGTAKPTVANVINTSGVAISSGTAVISTTTSDFTTTAVTADDIFAFDITAASGVAEITFQLKITKS